MEILPEYLTGYIYLTKEDYAKFSISRGDTEGIVNYLLTLKDVMIAALITDQNGIIKFSLGPKGISPFKVCPENILMVEDTRMQVEDINTPVSKKLLKNSN